MANSSKTAARRKSRKPDKPYKDFPLFPHASGRWAKKIRGRVYYFGRWGNRQDGKIVAVDDVAASAQTAVDLYNEQRDDLYAGRTPRKGGDGLTVRELLNRFLTVKTQQVDSSELTNRSFVDYKRVCDRVYSVFGPTRLVEDLAADDFEHLRGEISKTGGLTHLGGEINRTRVVFNYAWEAGLIEKPVRYGPLFKRPSKKAVKKQQRQSGSKMFEAAEIRRILGAAGQPLKAMILLACNGALGNSDVGQLQMSDVDLDAEMIDYPRPKTGVERRVPLWPETIAAIRESIENRTAPKDEANANLVFVTKYGGPWHVDDPRSPLSHEFRKLLQRIDSDEKDEPKLYRPRRGFYALRHTFRTIADATRDFPAIDMIMGHSDSTMGGHYRERIDNDRLQAVVEHVRAWLFGEAGDVEAAASGNLRVVG